MSAQVQRWLEHIRTLSVDIGPRGPTTEGERLGAEYCATTMRQLGLAPQVEGFISARSIFQPHLLTAGALLLAFAIYPLAGRASAAVAALISLVALVSDLLELSFIDNPLRRIVAKGPSQNVVATIAPAAEHRQDLVLIGHIDTQRTPIVFSTPRSGRRVQGVHHGRVRPLRRANRCSTCSARSPGGRGSGRSPVSAPRARCC